MPDACLQDDVFMAARDHDLVVLDARSGDYLCLPDLGREVTLSPQSSAVRIADPQIHSELTALDLVRDAATIRPRPLPPPPTSDVGLGTAHPVGARQTAHLVATTVQMLRLYRRRSFPDLVRTARAAPAGLRRDADAARRVARTFRAALPWIPFQGDCLFRSTFLRTLLRRQGLEATWVIGVQTWPFEAHCWLQVGDLVLDDVAEHAASFTPLAAF